MTETQEFAGAYKSNNSFLTPLERRLAPIVLPRIPDWLETYHLTLMTLLWSAMILVFSYMARNDLHWLWLVSVCIFLQYVTDHYDGKVGKYRNTGLARWGYYMDHLLDYFFFVFSANRLCVHSSGKVALSNTFYAGYLRRLRGEHLSGICGN